MVLSSGPTVMYHWGTEHTMHLHGDFLFVTAKGLAGCMQLFGWAEH